MRFTKQTNVSVKGFKRSHKHKIKKLAAHFAIGLVNLGYLEELARNVLDSLQSFRLAEWIVNSFLNKSDSFYGMVSSLASEAEQNYAWLKDEKIKSARN